MYPQAESVSTQRKRLTTPRLSALYSRHRILILRNENKKSLNKYTPCLEAVFGRVSLAETSTYSNHYVLDFAWIGPTGSRPDPGFILSNLFIILKHLLDT